MGAGPIAPEASSHVGEGLSVELWEGGRTADKEAGSELSITVRECLHVSWDCEEWRWGQEFEGKSIRPLPDCNRAIRKIGAVSELDYFDKPDYTREYCAVRNQFLDSFCGMYICDLQNTGRKDQTDLQFPPKRHL